MSALDIRCASAARKRAGARTIQLGHLTATLDSEADVQVLDTLAANDQNGLKDLVPQDLWPDELQRSACGAQHGRADRLKSLS